MTEGACTTLTSTVSVRGTTWLTVHQSAPPAGCCASEVDVPANGRWPYCDPRWTKVRAYILARDGYRCTVMAARHSRILDVDHAIEWTERPDLAFDPANLRTLCRLHHNRKTHGRRRRNSRRW